MADEVKVKYTADFGQIEKELTQIESDFKATETAGKTTFNNISSAAVNAKGNLEQAGKTVKGVKAEFNGLGNSINQITREASAFTFSFQTGLLAISNNLPILVDELGKVRQKNLELTASGQAAIPVWKTVTSTLFSLGSIINIVFAAVTIFGPKLYEFAKGWWDSSKAIVAARIELFKYSEVSTAATNAINKQSLSLKEQNKLLLLKLNAEKNGISIEEQKARNIDNAIAKNNILIAQLREEQKQLNFNLYTGRRRNDTINDTIYRIQEQNKAFQQWQRELRNITSLENQIETIRNNRKAESKYEKEQEKIQKIIDARTKKERAQAQADADFEQEILRKREENRQKGIEATLKSLDKEYEKRRKKDEENIKDELNFSETSYARKQELLQESLDKGYITQLEFADATKQIELQKQQAYFDTAQSFASILGSIASIAGQQTEEGKALAIAQTTIETYVAAQRAYSSQLTIPSPDAPFRATIAAAAAVAAGLARVANIIAVQVPQTNQNTNLNIPDKTSTSNRFKDGVVDLRGAGTETSDSIPAWLSAGESVIKASSTRAKKDDLRALNKSVPDYERLIMQKYVKPAVDKERQQQREFAQNIAESFAMNFSDGRIVKAIEKNRPATAEDIARLTSEVQKSQRISKFESKLKRPR